MKSDKMNEDNGITDENNFSKHIVIFENMDILTRRIAHFIHSASIPFSIFSIIPYHLRRPHVCIINFSDILIHYTQKILSNVLLKTSLRRVNALLVDSFLWSSLNDFMQIFIYAKQMGLNMYRIIMVISSSLELRPELRITR